MKRSDSCLKTAQMLWLDHSRKHCSGYSACDMPEDSNGRDDVALPSVVVCSHDPHPMPWESWSSRLFDFGQPNSPAASSSDEQSSYFTHASLLPPKSYSCPEAFVAEAFIDVDSGYCSEDDADKQDLQYRLLVGGLRSNKRASKKKQLGSSSSRRTINAMRKPCKTRYAFQNTDCTRRIQCSRLATQASVGKFSMQRIDRDAF